MTDKNRNLFVRVITALVLLPLVLYLVWLGGFWFSVLIGTAAALCALELNMLPAHVPPPRAELPADADQLSRKQRRKMKNALEAEIEEIETESALVTGAAIASMGGAFLLPLLAEMDVWILTPAAVIIAVVMVAFADALLFEDKLRRAPTRVSLAVLGAVYPGFLLGSLVGLRQLEPGIWWIVLTLTITWLNDTGAYFSGRFFGRHKLYPRISPSKTWEGAIGGSLLAIAGALVVWWFWLRAVPVWVIVVAALGGAVLGPVGDFSESMLKRAFGAKDSGRLLPGHGGMLDRIDALLFTAPFVLLCARVFVPLR